MGPAPHGSWSGTVGETAPLLRFTGVSGASGRFGFCAGSVDGWAAGVGDQSLGVCETGSAEALSCWLPKQSQPIGLLLKIELVGLQTERGHLPYQHHLFQISQVLRSETKI